MTTKLTKFHDIPIESKPPIDAYSLLEKDIKISTKLFQNPEEGSAHKQGEHGILEVKSIPHDINFGDLTCFLPQHLIPKRQERLFNTLRGLFN